jgi:hypothetical protein
MNKSVLKAVFINAKAAGAKYIGVKRERSELFEPEIIINPQGNFGEKYNYYMSEYNDELMIKGKESIRITGAAYGNSFEDIQLQLLGEIAKGWKCQIADAIDRVVDKALKETPPENEEERLKCEGVREAIKGMFLNESRTASEARFISENIGKYEEIFETCMNGDDLAFKKGLVELQRLQNEAILREDCNE